MATEKIYKNDTYLRTCRSVLQEVLLDGTDAWLVFDRTVFCPEGGGQPADRGICRGKNGRELRIDDAQEKDGVVYHHAAGTEARTSEACFHESGIEKGEEVELEIDWARRFDNMQRHLGEHLLSGAFFHLFGGVNQGFHMSEDGIQIDIDMSRSEEICGIPYDRITWEMAEEAEFWTNSLIWKNVPVVVEHYDRREDAEKRPLRKELKFDHDITIVRVGDFETPDDCVACCGTHPDTTGQVGLVKVYRIEPNRGMSRITLEAGKRAFTNLQRDTNLLYELETALSAGEGDVLAKFEAERAREAQMTETVRTLRRRVASSEADGILRENGPCRIRRYRDLSEDDVVQIGKLLMGKLGGSFALLCHDPSNTVFVFSDGGDTHAGKLVRSVLKSCPGKGGGGDTNARALLPDARGRDAFLKSAEAWILHEKGL